MLMDAVDEIGWDGGDFDGIEIDKTMLESNDVDRRRLPLFLYQAGYLTIKDFDEDTYTLGIPNGETRNAVYTSILPRLAE